jgi:hypothetical protein
MVCLQTTYELCFGEAYFEYFESCDFSRCELIDTENISLPSQNVKLGGE